jgi:hypothetical protein
MEVGRKSEYEVKSMKGGVGMRLNLMSGEARRILHLLLDVDSVLTC